MCFFTLSADLENREVNDHTQMISVTTLILQPSICVCGGCVAFYWKDKKEVTDIDR